MDNILNLSFAAVEGESLLMSLSGVALSSGSACTSASLEPSGFSKLTRDLKATYKSLNYKGQEILDIEKPQRDKLKFSK